MMLTWDDLTSTQKHWVTLVQMFHPEIKDSITFQQLKSFHDEFKAMRSENKRFKTGFPIWLITHNAVERGVYFFPSEENVIDSEPDLCVEIDPQLELFYKKELENYGIRCSVPA
jgi:hypothetical protein